MPFQGIPLLRHPIKTKPFAMQPEELLYAKTHEWIAVAEQDGAKVATIGISAYAVESLTDLVFIELPKVGQQVSPDASFCEVESVKAVSDIYCPVAVAKSIEVNESLRRRTRPTGRRPLRQRLDRQSENHRRRGPSRPDGPRRLPKDVC